MTMNTGDYLANILKDQMDFEEFRDSVIALIWRDDMEELRRVCRQQVMLSLFLEKVVGEIAPGNTWNDVLCLIARRLIEADPDMGFYLEALEAKKPLVPNSIGGREILESFVRVELSPDEFMQKIELIADTHTLMGLAALVADNPQTTRVFVLHILKEHSKIMDPNTRLFMLLCETAMAYRNYHHKTDLLEALEKAGGTVSLLKSDEDGVTGGVLFFDGEDSLFKLEAEARRARGLIARDDYQSAIELYEDLLPKMDTIYANKIPGGGTEYENALLFLGILLAISGEEVKAQEHFMKCITKRYHYGDLLLLNTGSLRSNAATIRKAFGKVPANTPSHLAFDKFFEQASGHSYAEANQLFDQFLILAGDREMEEAFELSEKLRRLYEEKRNLLVKNSLCEFLVTTFRTCYLVLRGDVALAQQEYFEEARGEAPADVLQNNFARIASDPEKTLSHYFGD